MKNVIHHHNFDENGKIHPDKLKKSITYSSVLHIYSLFLCPCEVLQPVENGKTVV